MNKICEHLIFSIYIFSIFSSVSCCSLLTLKDYENYASENLPKGLFQYLTGGAGGEETLSENHAEFLKVKILPRYLRDVSNSSTNIEILNKNFNMPIGISPSGLQKRWNIDGELATIKAAAHMKTIMILSIASSYYIEDVSAASPEAEKWLQVFIFRNFSITLDLVHRAEAANFGAIVVTVDMPVSAIRYHNIRNNYKDVHEMVNYSKDETDTATWDVLANLINSTKLPVIVKGILTVDDALLAKSVGARGIIVSNHGGREIDGAISSIEALAMIITCHPELRENPTFDIYFDGGIRSGVDVFRALAIGAKFVFVGRPPLWELFHSGQKGVQNVLGILQKELETVMNQSGCNSISCIQPSHVKYKI